MAGDRVVAPSAEEVLALKGRSVGPSDWLVVEQDRVDGYARAADDWHWAHNDVERASRGPFGGPIGHAHLTLALVPHLFASLVGFAEGEDAMFYGYNRVRFPTAVGNTARRTTERCRLAPGRGHRSPGTRSPQAGDPLSTTPASQHLTPPAIIRLALHHQYVDSCAKPRESDS